MSRKRDRSSSSEEVDADGNAIWRKVCIVTRSSLDWYGIYIFDLTNNNKNKSCVDDFTPTSPTIRINSKYFLDAAFCVLGSTLYAFEGFDNDMDSLSKERGNKLAYSYDLSSSSSLEFVVPLKLEKRMMRTISPMHYPKYGSPIATPTPGGKKILCFSTFIDFRIPNKCDFELYDPVADNWKELPGISREDGLDRFCRGIKVHSFTFTKPSVLLIQTDVGLYSLDFSDDGDGHWERLTDFHGCAHVPQCGAHFAMVETKLCLTPNHPFVINPAGGEWKRFYYPNLSCIPRPDFSDITTSIALNDDDKSHFCILQTGIARDSMQARLTLDVCTLDLSKLKLRRSLRNCDLPGTTIVKSFKFFVENQLPIDRFYPVFFSFIPPPITQLSSSSSG